MQYRALNYFLYSLLCTHSIFLVPFQCSIEEIHGNVFILIKPLNDKWLEPPKKKTILLLKGQIIVESSFEHCVLLEAPDKSEYTMQKQISGPMLFI